MLKETVQHLLCMVDEMKYFRFIFLLLIVSISKYSYAFEILSKKDAERTFNKSLNEWKNDTNLLLKSGNGEVIQEDDRSVTMIIFISNSILKVSPQYKENNLNRPWKIAVAVEQNKELTEKTKLLGEDGMRKLVTKWYKEMMPEYTVMTEFDLKGESLQINFSIFEYGTNSLIDSVGNETSGCWQGCIKK
jgi:hypothetical protein